MPQPFESGLTLENAKVLPGDPLPGFESIVLQQLRNLWSRRSIKATGSELEKLLTGCRRSGRPQLYSQTSQQLKDATKE